MDLSSFIGAAEWSVFARSFHRRQLASQLTAAEPGRFQGLWSDWELAAMLRFSRVAEDAGFRLFTRGKMVPREAYLDPTGALRPDVMQKLWATGVSLTLRYLEDFSNRVLALTRSLEAALHCPVQVNLYNTPGEAQALGAHFDDHDVLVLQLHGRKTWEIYADFGEREGAATGFTPEQPKVAPTVVTLETGGWLYVPRGVWHSVRNRAAEPSIHFTVSFHPMSWGRLLQRGLEKAVQTDPALSDSCPAGGPISAAEVGRHLASLQASVMALEDYYGSFARLETPVPDAALVDRARQEAAGAATHFAWRSEEVSLGGEPGVLHLGYRRRPLLLRPELAPVVRRMAEKVTFHPGEIGSLDAAEALLLCRFLTGVGVLRLLP